MGKNIAFQDRLLLNLLDDKNTEVARHILKSPLNLSKKVIVHLFENKFQELRDKLDSIKEFTAGINRAENIGKGYSLAKYYPYLFSFHQFFHSSYRARQGKTLEETIKQIVKTADKNFFVPDKLADKKRVMSEVFKNYTSNLDIDVVTKISSGRVLAIQLRSRDDTGGTTAKGSLVDCLKMTFSLSKKPNTTLFYLVGIWDIINSSQKVITIDKIYESLKPYLDKQITREKALL